MASDEIWIHLYGSPSRHRPLVKLAYTQHKLARLTLSELRKDILQSRKKRTVLKTVHAEYVCVREDGSVWASSESRLSDYAPLDSLSFPMSLYLIPLDGIIIREIVPGQAPKDRVWRPTPEMLSKAVDELRTSRRLRTPFYRQDRSTLVWVHASTRTHRNRASRPIVVEREHTAQQSHPLRVENEAHLATSSSKSLEQYVSWINKGLAVPVISIQRRHPYRWLNKASIWASRLFFAALVSLVVVVTVLCA